MTAGDFRSAPVPDGLAGERVDSALARMFGLSRTRAADLIAQSDAEGFARALGNGGQTGLASSVKGGLLAGVQA